jgi:hypothetical protein
MSIPRDPSEALRAIEAEYALRPVTRIVEATYGSGEDRVDVTAQLRAQVRDGQVRLTVANHLFGDPCPNRLKTLRVTYELAGASQPDQLEVVEHQRLFLVV